MRNFVIQQPLSAIEMSYQAIQMASTNLDQNLPLMEEYDPVALPISAVRSPNSLDILYGILS